MSHPLVVSLRSRIDAAVLNTPFGIAQAAMNDEQPDRCDARRDDGEDARRDVEHADQYDLPNRLAAILGFPSTPQRRHRRQACKRVGVISVAPD